MSIITKYLSEFQRAEIARSLFTVTSETSAGEMHGLCPIHGESKPSFSYNFQKNTYNCLACGVSLGIDLHAWALKKRLERLNGEEKALHREV